MADTYWAEREGARWDVYGKQRGWMAQADTERAVEAWEGPAAYKSIFARGLADLEDKAAECWAAMLAAARKGE